jgi:capsular polysaccharide biosynthesis protein
MSNDVLEPTFAAPNGAASAAPIPAIPPPARGVAAALRSSWLMILACVIVAVAGIVGFTALQGPQYSASSEVLIQFPDVPAIATGQASSSNTSDVQTASAALYARSGDFAHYVAASLHESDWQSVQNSLDAIQESGTDVLQFTAKAKTSARAILLADAAAQAFSGYSTRLYRSAITQALKAADALKTGAGVSDNVNRLRLAGLVNPGNTPVGHVYASTKLRPLLMRELAEGLVVGLVVGLLLMALREGWRSTRVRTVGYSVAR